MTHVSTLPSCDQSGFIRNLTPSIAPGSVKERTANKRKITKRAGIMILLIRSIPFVTPNEMMRIVSMMDRMSHGIEDAVPANPSK